MRQAKVPEDKFTFKIAKNKYKTRLNQLRANAWLSMDKDSWIKCMSKMGEVIVNEEENEIKKDTIIINEEDLTKEFTGKKQLYQYFGFKNEKELPEGYEIRSKFKRENGKLQRMYSLVKVE